MDSGRHRFAWWSRVWMPLLAIGVLVPTLVLGVYVIKGDKDRQRDAVRMALLEDEVRDLTGTISRQSETLEANGLPSEGSPGATGAAGRDGRDGEDGSDGLTVQGPPGVDGTDGTDGSDGDDGRDGRDGESIVGPPGPAGQDSTVPGPQGPQGEKGDTGSTGPAPLGIWVPDGQGATCLATDPDADGIYACPT